MTLPGEKLCEEASYADDRVLAEILTVMTILGTPTAISACLYLTGAAQKVGEFISYLQSNLK